MFKNELQRLAYDGLMKPELVERLTELLWADAVVHREWGQGVIERRELQGERPGVEVRFMRSFTGSIWFSLEEAVTGLTPVFRQDAKSPKFVEEPTTKKKPKRKKRKKRRIRFVSGGLPSLGKRR
jgi:hypothetical protein